jgi:hypothetical protein
MFGELERQGFIVGQNLTAEWRVYGTGIDLIPEFVAELVKAQVDIGFEGRFDYAAIGTVSNVASRLTRQNRGKF